MKDIALCVTPAVALIAFAVAFIRTFRPTDTTEGEQ